MPTNNFEPITRQTAFDLALIRPLRSGLGFHSVRLYVKADAEQGIASGIGATFLGHLPYSQHSAFGDHGLDFQNEEFVVVQERIDAGNCEVRYGSNYPGITREELLLHRHWEILMINPFEPAFGFFEHIAHSGEYVDADAQSPGRFRFPGIVEGANRRLYKRDNSPDTPDVLSLSALATEGWTPEVPYGSAYLYAVDVLDHSDTIAVQHRQRVYHRRKDLDGTLRSIARKWHEYWTGLTSSEQGINTRRTVKSHVEHAIGRVWAAKPLDDSLRVFREGNRLSAVTVAACDAEDWYLGNLEQWAYEWGFPALALALNTGTNRALLDLQLESYTLCEINENGSIGDLLSNPGDGILEATWDAWGSTHYNAALGTVVTVDAGADRALTGSALNQALIGTSSVVNPVGSTTHLWEQLSGPSVTLMNASSATSLFVTPTLVAGADALTLEFKYTVTNNGETASDTMVITINPPTA